MAQKVSTTINFEVTQITEGQYVVRQLEDEKPVVLNSANRKEFEFKVHGYVDPDDKEIAVWPSVLGVQIGDGYKAGFSSGIQIQIVLAVYNGSVRFYVENRVLKMNLHLKPVIHWGDDVNFNGDIISF
ncbi:uncharacterized protein RSE6_14552 [Rhynchosporium secalis]|uniref:Uncharacterized protein n=1 Tax=Rhynchosporium secalis TaxID=38038 RepID=A0A1E1MVL0_RHYSE|nr:uncharacterized protein RSE6_14552 [Rhynchosporium secalis]